MPPPVLHNVTFYVEQSTFEAVRAFYADLAGAPPVWEEPAHIACFGSNELAVCVHEEEAGRPAGTTELFFWTDDVADEVELVDPAGHRVRLHRRR